MVADEGDVANEEDAIFDEGDVLDMEDWIVDEEDDATVEDVDIAIEVVADVTDEEDEMLDDAFGLMPHADESLSALILCQLPLWSVQS